DREEPDRLHRRAQVAQRREERRDVQERRQDAEEDDLRLELELRHARNDAEHEAAEDEQDRIRDPKGRRDREEGRDGEEQRERDEPGLEVEMHQSRPTTALAPAATV